jgi:hypothetical protein
MWYALSLLLCAIGLSLYVGKNGSFKNPKTVAYILGMVLIFSGISWFLMDEGFSSGKGLLRNESFLHENTLYIAASIIPIQGEDGYIAEVYDENGGVFWYRLEKIPYQVFYVKRKEEALTFVKAKLDGEKERKALRKFEFPGKKVSR